MPKLCKYDFKTTHIYLLALLLSTFYSSKPVATDLNLPDLGHSFSNIATPRQEYHLGQKWMRAFRGQVPTSIDPFVVQYTENLINKLAVHSDLQDPRLNVIVVENPSLNAFAVPGGIIGINTGLFKYAKTEQQFAAVMAHELAHLSQRHYARKVEEQKQNYALTLAGIFASILIAASTDGDQGIAAISATQALSADAQLRFSRGMEQEADRVGLQTLLRANMNPYAMPEMFEQMLTASQYSRRPPEFLLTHPVTESRISDSLGRARKHPQRYFEPSEEYEMVKIRILANETKNTQAFEQTFRDEIKGNRYTPNAAKYGLVLALIKNNKLTEAQQLLGLLLKNNANNMYFLAALAETYKEQKNYARAEQILTEQLSRQPNNHPLSVKLAELLMLSGKHNECAELLKQHTLQRAKDDYIWYLLAEAEGLRGNILGVHLARAEYFSLNGIYSKAILQLQFALKALDDTGDPLQRAKVEQRLRQLKKLERESIS